MVTNFNNHQNLDNNQYFGKLHHYYNTEEGKPTYATGDSRTEWKIFNRHPNAEAIAKGLDIIPSNWALTPLREKKPYRESWQTERPVSRDEIRKGIRNGNRLTSKRTGKPYTAFDSGFGLRLGDVSYGLIAIDVDGETVDPLLQTASGGYIPKTVKWTSGKAGRYQLLYRVPKEWRDRVSSFTYTRIGEYNGIRTLHDEDEKLVEALELRYNRSQSALPPSYHPTTGAYKWINSPQDTEVALAPDWLLNWLVWFADKEKQAKEEQEKKKREREQRIAERQRQRQINGYIGANSLEDALEKAIDSLDHEEIFKWDGHQFKPYGQNKLVGYCPRHASQSGTAFQVINPRSKEWYCHSCQEGGDPVQYRNFLNGGNGTPKGQDFIEIARELCEEANVEFPEYQNSENAKEAADRALFEKIGESPTDDPEKWLQAALNDVISNEVTSAEQFLASEEARKALNEEKTKLYRRVPQNSKANYKPNQLDQIDGPVIFQEGQCKQVLSEAVAKKYSIILYNDGAGKGKTYKSASLSPANFDLGTQFNEETGEEEAVPPQLVFFFPEPDSPPVNMEFKGWKRLTTLNDQNCQNVPQRKALGEKGLGKSGSGGKGDLNPICSQCPALSDCREGIFPKSEKEPSKGFKYLVSSDFSEPKVYGHPKGFTRDDNSHAIGFFDEFGKLISPTVTEEFDNSQLSAIRSGLRRHDEISYALGEPLLEPELAPILNYLEDKLCGAEAIPKFGIPLAEMQKHLPNWDDEKASEIVQIVDELEQEWLNEKLKHISPARSPQEIKNEIDKPWFATVLSILFGQMRGALRLGRKKTIDGNGNETISSPLLFITQINDDQIALVKSFKTSILLDATLTKDDLVFEYGFSPDEILEVRQEPVDTPNLKVVQLTHAGLNTSQRSEAGQKRKQKILNEIKAHHRNVGAIDYQNYADEGDLHHFRSGEEGARGSNRFINKDAVVSVGTPFIAVNAVLDQYQTITGKVIEDDHAKNHEGFKNYYNKNVEKEEIQEIGRPRANLRPEQPLTYYMVKDINPEFLSRLGCEVTAKPIWHLLPDEKPKLVERLEQLSYFFASLYYSGTSVLKAKQKDAAHQLNCKKPVMSRLANYFGGWIKLKSRVNTLFKRLKATVNFSDFLKLLESELFKIYGDDLLESEEKLVNAIEQYGWEKVEGYFDLATLPQKGQMMGVLLALLFNGTSDWLYRIKRMLIDQLGLSEQNIGIDSPP